MRLQTILNRVEKFKSFTCGEAHLEDQPGGPALVVRLLTRKNSLPYCSGCLRRGRPYDHPRNGGSNSSPSGASWSSWPTGCGVWIARGAG
jgi:hypothetical protein